MGRLLGRIWVSFTTCLIGFIAYSSQLFIIWPWYGRVLSIDLIQLLLPFNILVGLLYWNYYLTVVTDPGRVPKSWEPNTQSEDGFEVKRLTGSPRYCRMCNGYKPPRTHHCRQCRRCVLRMDHHCPWVNNCVGFYNYGHFIRFLFFVDVACSYHLMMITRRALDAVNGYVWDGPDVTEFILLVLNYVTCVPVLLCVGFFSLYHFYCLSTNTTTIEGWEKDKAAMMVRKGRIHEVKFPYNIGRRKNIESVLGNNPLLWCCPSIPTGDGLKYQVAQSDDTNGQSWPPEDPTKFRVHPDYNSEGDDHQLILPDSPWTYENGSLNPDLRPTNAYRRPSKRISKADKGFVSNVPPYHPDYVDPSSTRGRPVDDSSVSSSDSDDYRYIGNIVREGSEGYEVKQVDREEILRRYILSRGEEVGHYRRYAPEESSEDEDVQGEEEEEVEEDHLPLGAEA